MKNFATLVVGLMAFNAVYPQPPDSSQFYFQKGIEEKNQKHFLVASKYLDKAIEFNPKFREAYLENGYINLEMRKTDAAKAQFTKLYELDPANAAAIKELSALFFSYRQFQKAIEFASKCSGCENAQKIMSLSYFQLEDYGNAIKGLLNLLAKTPADAEATYTLARSYLELEEYKTAVPYYTKAVALDAAKNVWAYELGMLYYTLEDYKNAMNFFNKAAENGYPPTNDFTENLGYSCIYSGEFERGEKILLGLLAKKPGNKDILRDIAEAYYHRQMFDKSLEFCQKLMEMDTKDGKALYQAGMCFQKKGEKDRGQQMCDKAIEMDPSLASMRQKNMSAGL